jgi:hypothetical protein
MTFCNRIQKFVQYTKEVNFLSSLSDLKNCDVLFFCHDVDRGVDLLGKAYSPLIDSVREDMEKRGMTCVVIANPFSKLVGNKAWGSPVCINRSFVYSMIKIKIGKLFGVNKYSDSIFELYTDIIKKTNSKCLVTIGAPVDLCRAAKNQGVYHCELLHGIGYHVVPWGWLSRAPSELPTAILSLDSVSTQTFKMLEPLGVKTLQIPHPFIKRFLDKNKDDDMPNEWHHCRSYYGNHYKKKIMVSLSPGYSFDNKKDFPGYDVLSNGLFPDPLVDIIKKTNKQVLWLFRFHPVQMRLDKYKPLFSFMDTFCKENKNTEWVWSSSNPLPVVVRECQGNIGMNSMTAYDAAYMGVPSLMLCPNIQRGGINDDWFADLEATGYVTKLPINSQSILEWVDSVEKKQPLLAGIEDQAAWERAIECMLGEPNPSNAGKQA